MALVDVAIVHERNHRHSTYGVSKTTHIATPDKSSVGLVRQDWLMRTADVSQVCASLTVAPSREMIEHDLPVLIGAIPQPTSRAEVMVLWGILLELYLQLEMFALSAIENPSVLTKLRHRWFEQRQFAASPAVAFLNACRAIAEFLPSNQPESPHVKAKREFDVHWDENISLSQLARRLGVHPRTLRRNFKSSYGVSIRTYRQRVRVQHATDLLVHTDLRTGAIARLVGCADHPTFDRMIKRATGQRPTEIRRRRK
jgi:AraC-like DNA-binding protein